VSSLRQNLAKTLLTVIAVLASVSLLVIYLSARYTITEQFDIALRAKAQVIETLTRPAGSGVAVSFSDHFFRGFDDESPRPTDFYELWDSTGRSLNRSESLLAGHLLFRSDLPPTGRIWTVDLPHGHRGRALGLTFVPHTPGQHPTTPVLTLIVVSYRDDLDRNLRLLIALCAACGGVLLGATLWLIPATLRRGLRPLEQLGDQAAAIDSRSLATRFSVDGLPKELRPIAGRLNDLLARIEYSFERERRFSADLAHELRTPLTELRSAAECALRWPEARDSAVDEETLAIALQMEGMVGHMLALTRSEQGQLKVSRENVQVDVLIASRWERLKPRALARGLTEHLELAPSHAPVNVTADLALTRSIIDNLLENAVEYTSPQGAIEIAVTASGCRFINTARGLEAADVGRLFDRFWRKEVARSGGLHVGLGLPLSRAFAEAMGWTLQARQLPEDRLEITLAWA